MTTSRNTSAETLALLVLTVSLTGCGGEFNIAPVSGVVTLDGQPLENASLYFQPQRGDVGPVVGPPSIGVTDADGRYRLLSQAKDNGAVVGKHVVSISTFEARMVNPEKSDRMEVVSKEIVPRRYRSPSELSFEVPSGGTNEANFDLTSG